MKPSDFKEHPKTRKEIMVYGNILKNFLNKKAGGRWKIFAHHNIHWFVSVQHGTLSVSWYPKSYCNGGFFLMNSGDSKYIGTGDVRLTSFRSKSFTQLLRDIDRSILEFKAVVKKDINNFNRNDGIKNFKSI